MKTQEAIKRLEEIGACSSALEWLEQFDTLEEAWDKCNRVDWMSWLLCRLANREMLHFADWAMTQYFLHLHFNPKISLMRNFYNRMFYEFEEYFGMPKITLDEFKDTAIFRYFGDICAPSKPACDIIRKYHGCPSKELKEVTK